uniref:Uncharacterized protein n=1 Tax=Rhizophora mucronata TaxID=61149 RepID=A0A2P2KM39_RHIMU
MDSTIKFGEGTSIPQRKNVPFMGSWVPLTPEKPVPTRWNLMPVSMHGSHLGRVNWQELAGFTGGYAQEPLNYGGVAQNYIRIDQADQNGCFHSCNAGLAVKNDMINNIPGPHTQVLFNESAGCNKNPMTNLLALKNAAPIACQNRTLNGNLIMGGWPWILSYPSHVNYLKEINPGACLPPNQAHCSSSNLLSNHKISSQMPQYGFPTPYSPNYDLNSQPRTEAEAASSVMTPHSTLPDKAKNLENHQPYVATADLLLDKGLVREKCQQHNQVEEPKESDREADLTINLNKTPDQKQPRRRKHRPKVITDGKPKRTPRTTTKKISESAERLTGKRKHVYEKDKKQSLSQQSDSVIQTSCVIAKSASKSCRRALKFDSRNSNDERQQEILNEENTMSNLNTGFQDPESSKGGWIKCRTPSGLQVNQQSHLLGENKKQGGISNLVLSTNHMPSNCMPISGRKAAAFQLIQHEDTNAIESGTSFQKHTHEKLIGKHDLQGKINYERLTSFREVTSQNTPLCLTNRPSYLIDGWGSKREHCNIEWKSPFSTNRVDPSILSQEVFQINNHQQNESISASVCSEAHKKRKVESVKQANTYGMPPSVAAVKSYVQISRCKNNINQIGSTSKKNYEELKSHSAADSIKMRETDGINKFSSEWYILSMASLHNLSKQTNLVTPSCTERRVEANRSGQMGNFLQLDKKKGS